MMCPKCNNTIPDGASRCEKCGTVFAPPTYDPNWRKGLRSTKGYTTGIVFGIILLSAIFPLNGSCVCLSLIGDQSSQSSKSDPTVFNIFFGFFALASLIGGLVLLILCIKKRKKAISHNAELLERHKADIEMEKAQRARQQQSLAVMQNRKPAFNAGTTGRMIFELNGTLSTLQVYEDRVIHIAKTTARSYVAGKFFNGTKEYFYSDLTNVQYREATPRFNGYLQFDYPGAMNISRSGFGGSGGNYNSENSFIFDKNVRMGTQIMPGEDPIAAANRIVSDAYRYIYGRIMEEKKSKKEVHVSVESTASATTAADELKKYNELLQSGAITQEEYDEVKKKYL